MRTALTQFTTAAQQAFGADVLSVVLFGSAAEGRMRKTSDVNVVVLRRVDPAQLQAIGEVYRLAHAAVRLSAMFILDTASAPKRVRRKGRPPLLDWLRG